MKTKFMVCLFSVSVILSAQENLLQNGNFEQPLKSNLWGNSFGKGPGKTERIQKNAGGVVPFEGKSCMRLYKERGPGGVQLQGTVPLQDARKIELTFRYRGDSANCNLGFNRKEGNRTVPILNTTGKPATLYLPLKPAKEWTLYRRVVDIPERFLQQGAFLQFGFQLWGGNVPREFLLDDVRFIKLKQEALRKNASQDRLKIKVDESQTFPDPAFGPVANLLKVENRNGLLYRNGKPYFWVGNGCDLGSAQSTPAGLWLARLQGISFVALESGSSFFGKKRGNSLEIGVSYPLGNHSWYREASRLSFLTEFALGSGRFVWSPLKKLSEENPGFSEIYYNAGHGITTDSGYPDGLKMLTLKRASTLWYALGGRPIAELNREPGPEPSNRRIHRTFRDYARRKYGTVEAANKVWRKNYKSWDEVVPVHLDTANMVDAGKSLALRRFARDTFPEMYYDWLRCVQLDTAHNAKLEADDIRKLFPGTPVTVDIRGHRIYSDSYCAYDPALIDRFTDLFFIHYGVIPFHYNHTPYHRKPLHDSTVFPLFIYNYFKTNTVHPIWNSEDIVSSTRVPGSNFEAMAKNDIGQFHASPWQFAMDPGKVGFREKWFSPEFDDSGWSGMSIPGCWDETEEFSGKSGWAWYRKTFVASKANRQDYLDGSRRFYLYGKGVAQKGSVWLNGHKLGDINEWSASYRFDVGPWLNFGGRNQITFFVDGRG